MSKMKKLLITGISYALVAALAIGGTIAYLQSEDSDVNVMTLGNVQIEQHEYERATNADGSYKTDTIDNRTSYVLQDFTQNKPLYPAVGNPNGGYDPIVVRMSQVGSPASGAEVLPIKNAQDKFVTVENTGKTDAYIRTIVAYEAGSVNTVEALDEVIYPVEFMTAQDSSKVWTKKTVGFAEIDGNNYLVVEFIYNGAKHLGGVHENGVLPAGETSYPSLCQVYMTSAATNEDCEAVDGNGNGTYDILVLSQAVQAAGFENAATALNTAFGATAENAAAWFEATLAAKNTITATTPEELKEAFENAQPGMTINAEGVTLAPTGDVNNTVNVPAGVTVKGATFAPTGTAYLRINEGSEPVVFEDCDFPGASMSQFLIAADACANVTFESCDFIGFITPNGTNNTDSVFTYNNCAFGLSGGTGYVNCMGGNHNFNNCTFDFTGGATFGSNQYTKWNAVNSYSENRFSASVTLTGCTFINCSTQKVGPNSTLTVK